MLCTIDEVYSPSCFSFFCCCCRLGERRSLVFVLFFFLSFSLSGCTNKHADKLLFVHQSCILHPFPSFSFSFSFSLCQFCVDVSTPLPFCFPLEPPLFPFASVSLPLRLPCARAVSSLLFFFSSLCFCVLWWWCSSSSVL